MPPPRKKANRVEAEATRVGQLKAEQRFRLRFLDSRFSLKNRAMSFIEYMKPYIAKLPKGVAILGLTYIVKNLIDESEEIRAKIHGWTQVKERIQDLPALAEKTAPEAAKQRGTPQAIGAILSYFELIWKGTTAVIPGAAIGETIGAAVFAPKAEGFEGMFPDWADWLIAFTIAYILVENAGAIIMALGDAATSLTKVVGFIVGV